MLDILKNELLEVLEGKKVSLVLLCQGDGHILWQRGRPVRGRNVFEAGGVPVGLIRRAIEDNLSLDVSNELIFFGEGSISESARKMMLRQILIFPVGSVFLYIDSGCAIPFSAAEVERIKTLALLLQKTFERIVTTSGDRVEPFEERGDDPVQSLLLRFAIEDDIVLLTGETGSGKTHLAEQIHQLSGRRGPFVVCDTTTLNQELLESELFGHRKGAFTGAVNDKRGLVDLAHKGTLFLDEIAEVPPSFQVRLMRFIESRQYRVLGDPVEREADVRLVAATNRNLGQMVAEKTFREDLYYRLSVFCIHLPPLRERKKEVHRLVMEYLHLLKGKELGEGFWASLEGYAWPGNIRELKTVLKRLGVLCESPIDGEAVQRILADSPKHMADASPPSPQSTPVALPVQVGCKGFWQRFEAGENFWQVIKEPFLERDLSRSEVKALLTEALERCRYKYINCLPLFNLQPSEYKTFMKFLIRNRLNSD
jgi:DNA-binding NtrC family response regulator